MTAEPSINAYRAGMEVEPPEFTPPEVRPGPPEWQKYRAPRFSPRVRVIITIAVFAVPSLLLFAAIYQVVAGDGRERAAAAILLFPMVPAVPLLIRAWNDLWGSGER
jgi:hypothetical protein